MPALYHYAPSLVIWSKHFCPISQPPPLQAQPGPSWAPAMGTHRRIANTHQKWCERGLFLHSPKVIFISSRAPVAAQAAAVPTDWRGRLLPSRWWSDETRRQTPQKDQPACCSAPFLFLQEWCFPCLMMFFVFACKFFDLESLRDDGQQLHPLSFVRAC